MKYLLSLLLFSLFWMLSPAQAQLFFADNFNNTTGTTTDLNTDLAVRQSGSYVTNNGTVNWADGAAGGAAVADYQNRLQQLQTNLQRGTSNGRIFAYLNQDFAADLGGTAWTASFTLSMEVFTSGGIPATATAVGDTVNRFILGASAAEVSSGFSTDWSAEVGFSPYYDGSSWQLRVGYTIDGVNATFGDIAVTPALVGSEYRLPTETVQFTIDEIANTFSVSYGSTNILSSASLGSALGAGRYLGYQAVVASGAPSTSVLQHEVDNLSVNIVPEPSSAALAAVFLAGLVLIRRRTRRAV